MNALRDLSRADRLRLANLLRSLAWALDGNPAQLQSALGIHPYLQGDFAPDHSLARTIEAVARECFLNSLELPPE